MSTTPLPRPWMPLYHRRRTLAHTTVPHTAAASRRVEFLRQAARRKAPPTRGLVAALRDLLRNPPPLRLRLDELTAETEAWIAELEERGDCGERSSR